MADDRTKKDYRDKTRINMNEKYEVSYWKDRFAVSGQALRRSSEGCWFVGKESWRVPEEQKKLSAWT
jgi:hypothetical protein